MNLSQMNLPDCGNLRSTKRKDVKQRITCIQGMLRMIKNHQDMKNAMKQDGVVVETGETAILKDTVKRNQTLVLRQEQELDELNALAEDLQDKLASAEDENEQLRKDLERERQVDMLPERSQIAALKDENERLHREMEKLKDSKKDK